MIIIILLFVFKSFISNRGERKIIIQGITGLIIPIICSIIVSYTLLSNATDYNKNELNSTTNYGTIDKRLNKINTQSESGSRIALWNDAISFIKENPIFGCGIGNWKIYSVVYSKFRDNDFVVPYHSHNDFLEITTETGLLGGILYISLFIVSGILILNILLQAKNLETNLIAIVALMCLSTYFLDAALNFPMERPPMQIMFALSVAIIFNLIYRVNHDNKSNDTKEISNKNHQIINLSYLFLIFISVPTLYFTYSHFSSLKIQKVLYFGEKKNNLTNDELDNIVTESKPIPNLNFSAIPIDITLANNYVRNGNFEKAAYLLERSKFDNPYLGIYEFNKGIYFFRQGKNDSSYKYFSIAFEKRPRSIDTYRNLIVACSQKKDTATLTNTFKSFIKNRNEFTAWQIYFSAMLQTTGRANAELIKLCDTAILKFPDSLANLKNLRNYMIQTISSSNNVATQIVPGNNVINGIDANLIISKINMLKEDGIKLFNEKKYKKAIDVYLELMKLQPNDYSYIENVAICFYILNDFTNANKYFNRVISSGLAKDGKSEFYNAISLFQINQKEKGCSLLEDALRKKYDSNVINQYKQIYCK
jgi:tetratricopeptide (TPR) repeat protein